MLHRSYTSNVFLHGVITEWDKYLMIPFAKLLLSKLEPPWRRLLLSFCKPLNGCNPNKVSCCLQAYRYLMSLWMPLQRHSTTNNMQIQDQGSCQKGLQTSLIQNCCLFTLAASNSSVHSQSKWNKCPVFQTKQYFFQSQTHTVKMSCSSLSFDLRKQT